MLTDRNAVQEAIQTALEARWKDDGIIVEDVALQEIRYGEQVTGAYAAAQEAQINVQTEQAKLEAAKVSAQQKVVQAQAEADANAILAASPDPGDPAAALPRHAQGAGGGRQPGRRARGLQRPGQRRRVVGSPRRLAADELLDVAPVPLRRPAGTGIARRGVDPFLLAAAAGE